MIRQASTLVAIGLVTLLAACGGGGGGGSSSSSGSGGGNQPPPDTTPNAFTFTAQGDTSLTTAVTSDEVTITGITAAAAVSIAGGEYSIDGGAFTSAAGTVANNQRVRVRVTTSGQFSTGATTTLTVGGVAGAFTATTLAMDITPAAFEFAKIANAARGSWASSASTTITGINTAANVSIANGEYSIAGGAFTSAAGTITSGQTIAVRAQAGATYSRATRATLTIGTVAVEFEIVSELPAYLPDATAFDGADTVYLLSNQHHMLFRWSVAESRYIDAWAVGSAGSTPTHMTYSPAHQRLYFGYASGAIRAIATTGSNQAEQAFANVPLAVGGVTAVGNYVLAQDGSGAWATHYIFDASGARTDDAEWNHISANTAWDAVSSRFYYFSMWSPADLNYEQIDQNTGTITQTGETPYHGAYSIVGPIRVSTDGAHVLLGSGDLYARTGLTWSGSLGGPVTDARWSADNSLVALTTSGNQAVVRRLASANLAVLEQRTFTGQALRVVGTDARMAVIVSTGTNVQIHTYVPTDDTDGDGVANTADAFPLDVAASVDSDRDGFPDAWNTGRSQTDSTTGLVLDSFPVDAACWLAAHGAGGVCNYAATMPNYTPDAGQIAQHGDVVYLLSSANRRVYRWSISGQRYLNPFVVGLDQGYTTIAPTKIAHSPTHQRLYLGYSTGAIRYIDLAGTDPAERAFGNAAMGVNGLVAVGNYVLAQDNSGAWATHYTFNASGAVASQREWNYRSNDYAWDAVNSRVYFTRDDTSPNDLLYETIDQTTGAIAPYVDSPYHGDYPISSPVRVSVNGQNILLGSGNLYRQSDLQWAGSLGTSVTDARWFADGSLAALTTASNQTLLRRLGANNLATIEQVAFTGTALRVVGSDARMVVVVMGPNTVQFHDYVPNSDSDGDGVANTADAFPLDVAASLDTDRDGYPNAWNAGRSQTDSTTGLAIDAFVNDSACWLVAHGSGGVCDFAATVPAFTPDAIEQNGDVVYLLSAANGRVYRRSISTGQYMNPYVVSVDRGFDTISPNRMTYSPAHQRLYIGDASGSIRYIDVTGGGTPASFANVATAVGSLQATGNYLVAQDSGYSWATHYVINASGTITAQVPYNYASANTAWDAASSRYYYFSYSTLSYEVIDQVSGTITSQGSAPYNGQYYASGQIRPTQDGAYVLIGAGDLFARTDLARSGSLGAPVTDARWFADGSVATLTTNNSQTILRRLGGNTLTVLEQRNFTGQALRVVGSDAAMAVIALDTNGRVQFHSYVPSNDSDSDGVANTADAFPLDVAASVDTDRDGYPDSWNAGRSQADSTTGLALDPFPNDAACWLAAHGSGGVCNYGATIPDYTPDQVANAGDVIYLLSRANRRVYRYSMTTGQYLNPYVIGIDQGFTTIAPTRMAYSATHQRLYVGYETGVVRYLDTTAPSPAETNFLTAPGSVTALAPVGNYLLAQLGDSYWGTQQFYDAAGTLVERYENTYAAADFTWDPVSSRLYFARANYSPGVLYYEVINPATGEVTSAGETTYYGEINAQPPVRVSPDGSRILLGSGDLVDRTTLTLAARLPVPVIDAQWRGGAIATVDGTDRVAILNGRTYAELHSLQYTGTPLRIVAGATEVYLVHVLNGTTAFIRLPFYDQDGDTIPRWWEMLYGLADNNAADAVADGDSDGASNATEYANFTNPTLADTDGDGLGDNQEIVTTLTDPTLRDTDGDNLSDGAEVATHNTNPLDTDSDDDGYPDGIEVSRGSNPNDVASLPTPIANFSTSFAGALDPLFQTPANSAAPWAIDATTGRLDLRSLKAGDVAANLRSSTRIHSVFAAGTLSFWVRFQSDSCCDSLQLIVDGVARVSTSGGSQWTQYTVPIAAGVRNIEWRYLKDNYASSPTEAAWIDDVSFAP